MNRIISVSIDEDLYKTLKERLAKAGVPISRQVAFALEDYFYEVTEK